LYINLKKSLLLYRWQILIISIWSIVQCYLYFTYGINLSFEAEKYIRQSDVLIEFGKVESNNFWFYSLEIFLISGFKLLGISIEYVVIIHLLISAIAVLFFYAICRSFTTLTTALICTLAFICNTPFFLFNFSLQSDSLYFNLLIIVTGLLLLGKKISNHCPVYLIISLVLLFISRPSSINLLIPLMLFFAFRQRRLNALRVGGVVLTGGLLYALIAFNIMSTGGGLSLGAPFEYQMIICGVSRINIPYTEQSPTFINTGYELFSFIFNNPVFFIKLSFLKSISFWGLSRSYYGFGHNILLGVLFYPFIVMAILSIKTWRYWHLRFLIFSLSFILITWLVVLFSCDDWHNRFFLGISPFLFLLSLPAINQCVFYLRSLSIFKSSSPS
jgi:hypothetical protein